MVAIAQSVEHLIVVQEVARSSRVSHPRSGPYSRLGSRGFLIYAGIYLRPNFVCHLCAKVGKNLATRSVPTLDLPHGSLRGPVSDGGEVCSDLLVDGFQALAVLQV